MVYKKMKNKNKKRAIAVGRDTKMNSWGCATTSTREGVCANASFCTTNKFLESKNCFVGEYTNLLRVGLAVLDSVVRACSRQNFASSPELRNGLC